MPGSNEYSMSPALTAGAGATPTLVAKPAAPAAAAPAASPFYQTQDFDKETIFKQRYGTNASRRDRRQFERYWNSEQRAADELAHTEAESQKYLASVDAYTQNALNKLKGVPAPAPTAPEFYKTKDFRTTKLAEMYGTDPSKRDLRQFERYMQSEQGQADWLAHEQAESQKYIQSWDDRIAFNKAQMAAAAPKPVLAPKPEPAPVVEGPKTPTIEEQIAGAKSFNEAFGLARKAGLKQFDWKGKPIAVKLAPAKPKQEVWPGVPYAFTENMVDPNQKTQQPWTAWQSPWQVPANRKGGRINYFQQGGAAPQDIQKQITALVQAAMQGDQKATETVNKIIEAAKAGDQQAMEMAQMIQQVAEQMKGQATAAKWGAKLGYIKSLKFAKGGKTCPACEAKKVEMKACGGKKAKKRYFGGLV